MWGFYIYENGLYKITLRKPLLVFYSSYLQTYVQHTIKALSTEE